MIHVPPDHVAHVRWYSTGDLNAFFALLLDNVVNLVVLTGILTFQFHMPADFVVTHMVPGTALGVFVGDLAYSWLAIRARDGRTAMPLGLDTPSTIGMAVVVIGPVYLQSGDPWVAWEVGMATMVLMGIAKTVFSFAGDFIARILPDAGLLGPLAGFGLALLGLFPLVKIFSLPIVGMVATGIVLYSLVARHRLPFGIPGALAAVIAGLVLYWGMILTGLTEAHGTNLVGAVSVNMPQPEVERIVDGLPLAIKYLPISIPFGLLTIIGGINVTASARAAGDDYRTRTILLIEAGATVLAGLFGGVVQSTPYIGHPAYKAMGARAGYTLATGLVVGIGGVLGVMGLLVGMIPEVVVAPILLFIGLEIAVQAFDVVAPRHRGAVALSTLPVIAYVVHLYASQLMSAGAEPEIGLAGQIEVLGILGRGQILTALLWGSAMVFIVERRIRAVLTVFGILAIASLFGVIHSFLPDGALALPAIGEGSLGPLQVAVAYALTGIVLAGLIRFGERGDS